eukprot:2907558-Amphidinium_carterae.1
MLTDMLRHALHTDTLPDSLQRVQIPLLPEFRPIALEPGAIRALFKLVCEQLRPRLRQLPGDIHGGMPSRSTTTMVAGVLNVLNNHKKRDPPITVVTQDIEKALDNLQHSMLEECTLDMLQAPSSVRAGMTWFRHNGKQLTLQGHTTGITIHGTCGANQGNSLSMLLLACCVARWLQQFRLNLHSRIPQHALHNLHTVYYVDDRNIIVGTQHAITALATARVTDAEHHWRTLPQKDVIACSGQPSPDIVPHAKVLKLDFGFNGKTLPLKDVIDDVLNNLSYVQQFRLSPCVAIAVSHSLVFSKLMYRVPWVKSAIKHLKKVQIAADRAVLGSSRYYGRHVIGTSFALWGRMRVMAA